MSANDQLGPVFLSFSGKRMDLCQKDIQTCVTRLQALPQGEELLWHRGGEHENAIGNLLLHLAGNIRQWILHGVDGQPDVRKRDDEFALDAAVSSGEALQRFNDTVDEARRVITELAPERLLEVIDPQPSGPWRRTPIMEAIFKVVSHLDHHSGQIILLTKQFARTDLDLSMPRKRTPQRN